MKHMHTWRTGATALAVVGTAAGIALGLAGCGKADGQAGAPAGGAPVSAAKVIEKAITETKEFSGRLEAVEQVQIRPRVSGFITAINFTPGATVRQGEVLFVIDPLPYQAEVQRAESAVAAARAKADLAQIELRRSTKLLGERAIAQREFDSSDAAVKQLAAELAAAQSQLVVARLNLGYTRVHAPVAGRVSKAEITLGNLVNTSDVLTSVVSLDRIYASFDGDEDTYLRVAGMAHRNQAVTVRIGLANENGFPHQGKLEFLDNRLDPATGAVRMRAAFANADNLLVPGLFARVNVETGNGARNNASDPDGPGQTHALLIADRAVGTDQDRKFVFVVGAGNKAEYRALILGPTADGLRVVRSGLKLGETIVVDGLQRVQPDAVLAPTLVAMTASVMASGAAAGGTP